MEIDFYLWVYLQNCFVVKRLSIVFFIDCKTKIVSNNKINLYFIQKFIGVSISFSFRNYFYFLVVLKKNLS